MSDQVSRRRFLKSTATAGLVTAASLRSSSRALAEAVKTSSPNAEKSGWLVGCQLYTFRRFSFYEALEKMAGLGIRYAEPAFFLGLDKARPALKTSEDLSAEVRKELKAKLDDRGMSMSCFYANLGNDKDRARKILDFAKEMGARTIVAEPPAEALDMVEKLCDEYDIPVAIHNHPQSPGSKYWNPDSVLDVCKGRGKRIGACCDTGHWVRSGLDPLECLKKLEGRIVGVHLKDVAESGKPQARDVPLGTGKANYAAVLKELRRQGYKGALVIEYEHDSPELLQDMAQCVAFVEKAAQE